MKRFIAIDGLDGSGKDTQARLIKEKYEKEGTVVIRSHPTTDNFFGRTSKNALQHEEETKWNKIVATIFYGADAIRYNFLGTNRVNDIRFGFKMMEEAKRKLMNFYNIASFFDLRPIGLHY